MGDQFIELVKCIIEDHIDSEDFSVSILAKEVGLSRSMLHRKLISLTGKSATDLITEIRLTRAWELLENRVATVAEIAYMVGYSSPSYFNKVFKKTYNVCPGEVGSKGSGKFSHLTVVKGLGNPGSARSNRRKIAWYFIMLVLVVLIVLNIMPRIGKKEIPDKSIAILPFKYLSDDPAKQYLADGVMFEILLNLSMIEDLRVMDLTSVEQYRESEKTATEICREMGVAYLLTGNFLKNGDQVRLIVQLIESGREGHIWVKKYDRSWGDIFDMQSEVAQLVAKELQAIITPEEKLRIEKVPTTSLTALDFYQRGRDEFLKFQLDNKNTEALERAEDLYYKALDYDSAFAAAYTGLASVYWHKHYWESYFSESFLDSVLILADKATSLDPQLSEAHTVKGNFYKENSQIKQAMREYDHAIKLNPNDWLAYFGRGYSYLNYDFDLVKAIEDFHKAASLHRGPFLPDILRGLGRAYWQAGFPEKTRFYANQALLLNGDSIRYYFIIDWVEKYSSNGFAKSLESIYVMDTTRNEILLQVGNQYGMEGKFEESLMYLKKYFERLEVLGSYSVENMQRLGYAYWGNGFYAEADYYFDTMIAYYMDLIHVGRKLLTTNYDLAGIYAFRGEKEKAYENLRIFNQLERIPYWWISLLSNDPLFDSIREEREFQQIVRDVEAKYQPEHERVRQWLEENDML